MQITQTYQEGHNMDTQHGSCCNLAVLNIFLPSNVTKDLYHIQALSHLYRCSFACLKSVLCKAKQNKHTDIHCVSFSEHFLCA